MGVLFPTLRAHRHEMAARLDRKIRAAGMFWQLLNVEQTENRDRAAICAIALSEDRYIDEWITYHRLLGFDRIFLYDNSSENTLASLPGNYPGFVEVIHFPGPAKQIEAYRHRFESSTREHDCRWMAFIDVDEFIVLRTHACIRQLLLEHCRSGALALNWVMFGSNGHLVYEPDPVLKRFTRRARKINRHVKCIVNIRDVESCGVHNPKLKDGTVHDCDGRIVGGAKNGKGNDRTAAIFHFYTKSREEFLEKIGRGRADTGQKRGIANWDKMEVLNNEVEDDRAWQFFRIARFIRKGPLPVRLWRGLRGWRPDVSGE